MEQVRAHRRLAAILAIDVAGYSRLVRDDEEGTILAVRRLRMEIIEPQIAKWSGRLVKTMGDGFLIEFSSAVDAVLAAVEIQGLTASRGAEQSGKSRLLCRAGVNLGDVVVDCDDLFGDGVNLASRIEALAEPGGLCVSAAVHEQVNGRTPLRFRDLGDHLVKNIDRPVQVYAWERTGEINAQGPRRPAPSVSGKPSIAVLPFQNMSGVAELDFFADGLVEDIITALSRFERFAVMARNSTFAYKGQAIDVKQVGRELGVRYVLEGSARRSGRRLRVTAQLIDARTGAHLWAERYDHDADDLFAVQDEITRGVAASTQTHVYLVDGPGEQTADDAAPSVEALVSAAHRLEYQVSEVSLRECIRLAEKAVALDPTHSRAHSLIASGCYHLAALGYAEDIAAVMARGRAAAEHAVTLNRRNEDGHWMVGMYALSDGDHDRALASLERAVEISPHDATIHGCIAKVLIFSGHPEKAIAPNDVAIRSNPTDPIIYFRYSERALAHVLMGEFENAIDWARRSVSLRPDWYLGHVALCAALAMAGRDDEARRSVLTYRAQCPGASLAQVKAMPFRDQSARERLVDALRTAGCPD